MTFRKGDISIEVTNSSLCKFQPHHDTTVANNVNVLFERNSTILFLPICRLR